MVFTADDDDDEDEASREGWRTNIFPRGRPNSTTATHNTRRMSADSELALVTRDECSLEANEWMLFGVAWESRDLSTSAKLGLGILYTVFMLSERDGVEKEVESEEKHQ